MKLNIEFLIKVEASNKIIQNPVDNY